MGLLEVEELRTCFHTRRGVIAAVDGVSFSVSEGATLGLVGESGCGKSVTALSIAGLLPRSGAHAVSGRVRLAGRELTALHRRELEDVRGAEIGMVFQDPLASLNPTLTVGFQLIETLRRHLDVSPQRARRRAIELLGEVRLPRAAERLEEYSHRLSGGMRQRVMIALAIACQPRLLIADEPTTALDVTLQAQILELLADLRREHRMAMILITHDMGVVAEVADDVAVMYAGQIVEHAHVVELFERPEHPYTEALLGSMPRLHAGGLAADRLATIPGRPPDPIDPPPACRFAPRCPHAGGDACTETTPPLRELRAGHLVRSWHPASERAGDGGRT